MRLRRHKRVAALAVAVLFVSVLCLRLPASASGHENHPAADTAERARRLEALGYIDVLEEEDPELADEAAPAASGSSAGDSSQHRSDRIPGATDTENSARADGGSTTRSADARAADARSAESDTTGSRYGVVVYDRERSWPGLNLYTPCGGSRFGIESWRGARIFDMEGHSVHEWHSDFVPAPQSVWSMARMDAQGHLYGVYSEEALLKLDWSGTPLWIARGRFHHDISFDADATVLALVMRDAPVEAGGKRWTIRSHGVAFIDAATGKVRRTLWLDETLAGHEFWREHLSHLVRRRDVLHANTVRASPVAVGELWKKGDIMVSARHLDRILVLDRDDGRLLWQWGVGVLQGQHDPHILGDGTILVFDNGVDRKRSRVLRVDPRSGEILWSYGEGRGQRFFSPGRGLAERLPNGNVLITSSAEARAFEVTEEGRKVWEYRAAPEPGRRQRLPFRMTRLPWKSLEEVPGRRVAPGREAAPTQPPARATDSSSTSSNLAPRAPESSR